MIADLKYGSIVYSAYIYLIIIKIMESMSLIVAVLGNGNCTTCCQQETNAMFCLVKHFIIYSMKHSPAREGYRFSAIQEISRILCNPKVQYYLLTPWSRDLLEKLSGSAPSQEIPRIFGTRRFITVLTSARQLSLS